MILPFGEQAYAAIKEKLGLPENFRELLAKKGSRSLEYSPEAEGKTLQCHSPSTTETLTRTNIPRLHLQIRSPPTKLLPPSPQLQPLHPPNPRPPPRHDHQPRLPLPPHLPQNPLHPLHATPAPRQPGRRTRRRLLRPPN